MDLGKKAKSRTPACKHADWSLELSADFFRIEWVASDSGYKQHLHCKRCDITAKAALPKKKAVEFEGYDDKPDRWQECEICSVWFEVEYDDSERVCGDCATGWWECTLCDTLRSINDDNFCSICSD